MTSEAAPEQKLHAVEARIEQAANDGGTNPEQLVQWRQECLALAQLACRADTGTPDKYQLGRACANLAAAYLASGATEAALHHAERAEALLLSDADRTEAAASLLPDVLHMLATSHAELGKYRRAAEYFNRALAASNTIYGKGHVRCCPVLRGWARMAVQREQDHTLAVQLLRKEMDVREAHMGRDPSADERAELVSLLQELAEMLLAAARQAEARSKLVAGGGRGGGSAAKGGAVAGKPRSKEARAAEARRAAELRDEAAELLRAKARIGGAAGDTSPALTEEAANMAIKLGQACSELGQWAQAEGAYLCALPWLEERHGMSDGGVIKLWAEVARLRMRQVEAAEEGTAAERAEAGVRAAEALDHVLTMQGVLHGNGAAALIPTAEALCKARVKLRQWGAAHAALSRAHALSAARHGENDPRTTRIVEVLGSLAQYLPPTVPADVENDENAEPLPAAG